MAVVEKFWARDVKDGGETSLGVPPGWEISTVIPFNYPGTSPEPNETEELDRKLQIDA